MSNLAKELELLAEKVNQIALKNKNSKARIGMQFTGEGFLQLCDRIIQESIDLAKERKDWQIVKLLEAGKGQRLVWIPKQQIPC